MNHNAENHFKQAQEALRAGNMKESLYALNQAIGLDPDNYEYYMARGDLRYRIDEYEGAANDLTKAIEFSSDLHDEADARSKRLIVYHYWEGDHWEGHLDELYIDLNWLIENGFATANRYSMRGTYESRFGHVENAVRDFTAAHELAPDSTGFLMQRATALYDATRYQDAINDLNRILESKAEESPSILAAVYEWRARAYHKLKLDEKSFNDMNQALRLQGEKPYPTLERYIEAVESNR